MNSERSPEPERTNPLRADRPLAAPVRPARPENPLLPEPAEPPRNAARPPAPQRTEPPRTRPAPETAPPRSDPPPHAGVDRRWFLGALALGAVAAAADMRLSTPRSRGLPMPTGQYAGPEYRAATLKLQPAPTRPMPPDHHGWPTCVSGSPARDLSSLDLVLVVDTTSSMTAVLQDVQANIYYLLTSLRQGGGDVRVGVVAYKDDPDEYIVKPFPFKPVDSGFMDLTSFVGSLQASGGGTDWPERLDAALHSAMKLDWRRNTPGSIVVITDAPPHPKDQAVTLDTARSFRRGHAGGQISVIDVGSGGDPFLPVLASTGGGQYVTYNGDFLKSVYPAITACPSK